MLSFLSFIFELLLFAGSIKSNASFPKPLSREEEQEYIKRIGKDEEAREKLIVHNLRLVAHIAKKYAKGGRDMDDLVSIGTIGLIKAVSSFSESRGSLSNYISKCVENEILMSMRSERKRALEVSMYDPLGADREGNSISLLDLIGTDAEAIFESANRNINAELLYKTMARVLTKREHAVLSLRCGLNGGSCMPQREVAVLLGISRSYVSRIEKKAMEKMAAALKDM